MKDGIRPALDEVLSLGHEASALLIVLVSSARESTADEIEGAWAGLDDSDRREVPTFVHALGWSTHITHVVVQAWAPQRPFGPFDEVALREGSYSAVFGRLARIETSRAYPFSSTPQPVTTRYIPGLSRSHNELDLVVDLAGVLLRSRGIAIPAYAHHRGNGYVRGC